MSVANAPRLAEFGGRGKISTALETIENPSTPRRIASLDVMGFDLDANTVRSMPSLF
jgi:hypothetical protein